MSELTVADNLELVQLRWHCGQLQYRARLMTDRPIGTSSYERVLAPYVWSPWQNVPGVKGDETDVEKWGNE